MYDLVGLEGSELVLLGLKGLYWMIVMVLGYLISLLMWSEFSVIMCFFGKFLKTFFAVDHVCFRRPRVFMVSISWSLDEVLPHLSPSSLPNYFFDFVFCATVSKLSWSNAPPPKSLNTDPPDTLKQTLASLGPLEYTWNPLGPLEHSEKNS